MFEVQPCRAAHLLGASLVQLSVAPECYIRAWLGVFPESTSHGVFVATYMFSHIWSMSGPLIVGGLPDFDDITSHKPE